MARSIRVTSKPEFFGGEAARVRAWGRGLGQELTRCFQRWWDGSSHGRGGWLQGLAQQHGSTMPSLCWWGNAGVGVCRVLRVRGAWQNYTKCVSSLLHLPPSVSMPGTTNRHRRLGMSSGYFFLHRILNSHWSFVQSTSPPICEKVWVRIWRTLVLRHRER